MPTVKKFKQKTSKFDQVRIRESDNAGFYNSELWRKTSVYYRTNEQPFCEACLLMQVLTDITPNNKEGVTDHVVPITHGGAMLDSRNFMSLCGINSLHNHHAIKSGVEQHFEFETIETENGLIPTERCRRAILGKITGKQ